MLLSPVFLLPRKERPLRPLPQSRPPRAAGARTHAPHVPLRVALRGALANSGFSERSGADATDEQTQRPAELFLPASRQRLPPPSQLWVGRRGSELKGAPAGRLGARVANYDDSTSAVHEVLWVVDSTHTK